jgi:hypothetical protein
MADIKISQLPVATSSSGTDAYVLVQGGATKQITYTNLFTNVALVTPVLGTPASGTLTNCTGLPVAGLSDATAGIKTFMATPSSANLAAALSDETGTGSAVFANTPTFTGMFRIPTAGAGAAGSTEADATSITTGLTVVTGADGTKGIKLPTAMAGDIVIVKNNGAAVLKVYPAQYDQINALTITTGAYSMAANTSMIIIAFDTTTWFTIPLVAS